MEKNQIIYIILFISVILILLILFLLFVLVWYRIRRNRHIQEKSTMHAAFKQELLQSRLEIQEQTFNIISAEIHDNVGQLLSLAKIQLSIVEQKETTDKVLIADIKKNLSTALNDLRDIAKSLNTERMQQVSLTKAISLLIQRINRSNIIKGVIEKHGVARKIDEQKKLILFRMVQEAVQNILKHAHATQIKILCHYNNSSLSLSILDNGLGFDNK